VYVRARRACHNSVRVREWEGRGEASGGGRRRSVCGSGRGSACESRRGNASGNASASASASGLTDIRERRKHDSEQESMRVPSAENARARRRGCKSGRWLRAKDATLQDGGGGGGGGAGASRVAARMVLSV
jgi:hypothetical protein